MVVAGAGTVAAQTAEAMAVRGRTACGATYGVATTGVAGPDPSEGHEPGTVFVAVAGPAGVESRRLSLPGDRAEVRAATVREVLSWLVARVGEDSRSPRR